MKYYERIKDLREDQDLTQKEVAEILKTSQSYYAQYENKSKIDLEIAMKALNKLEIDELGLDETDRRMLSTMINNFSGGPVGLETLAASIGEDKDTIEDMYEPYLMQIGFVARTPRGRIATPLAYEHLGMEYNNEGNAF